MRSILSQMSEATGVPPMILFVCEGNVCRSPWAERMVRHALAPLAPGLLRIESAGTRAQPGRPIDAETIKLLSLVGVDGSGHVARRVTADMLSNATLILTATRAQRRTVVTIHPRAVRSTFTMRQFGRLLSQPGAAAGPVSEDSVEERVRALIRSASAGRSYSSTVNRDTDDVADPFGLPSPVHELAAQQMEPGLQILCRRLLGNQAAWPSSSAG
jgi:protein-tyrosine phosphatase